MKIPREKWVWMPHAGHLCVGNYCQFHLTTRVGKYLISTLGEYWPDSQVRKIHADVHDVKWVRENSLLRGDAWDYAYMKRFGFETIGADRKYETMVFKATKVAKGKCAACPFVMENPQDLDFNGYNTAEEAYKGHMKMCLKYANK